MREFGSLDCGVALRNDQEGDGKLKASSRFFERASAGISGLKCCPLMVKISCRLILISVNLMRRSR
jgi:hypothetical protein